MNNNTQATILGLDPGTRFLGVVVVRGRDLLAYAVHELWNGRQPHDLIGQARRVIFRYIAEHAPDIVAIEAPYLIPSERAATLSTLALELRERSKDLGLCVRQLSPEAARRLVTGDPRSTKIEVAEALVRDGFGELRPKLPKRPTQRALSLRPRDRYWFHVFDALALAVAVQKEPVHSGTDEAGAPTLYAGRASGSTLKPASR
jgi:Holliday junction resolvasome RuvABC endonuclease subunit